MDFMTNNGAYETFTILGGDLRQAHLANALAESGKKVNALFLDRDVYIDSRVSKTASVQKALANSDVVVLPLPVSLDGLHLNSPYSKNSLLLSAAFSMMNKGSLVLAGKPDRAILNLASDNEIEVVDYSEREELAILNAVPTSEGAIAITMQELPVTVFGLNCLITGFGRISKVMARILGVMGATVTIAARKHSDLAWAQIYGCHTMNIAKMHSLDSFDVIYNTVPTRVFHERELSQLKEDCLIIDLASKPGGVDMQAAAQLGARAIWALSLPGKVAPITAGNIIKETISHIIDERGAG